MENLESTQEENVSSTAVLDEPAADLEVASIQNQKEIVEEKILFPTDQDEITSMIEAAFPNKATNKQLSARQSNSFSFANFWFYFFWFILRIIFFKCYFFIWRNFNFFF